MPLVANIIKLLTINSFDFHFQSRLSNRDQIDPDTYNNQINWKKNMKQHIVRHWISSNEGQWSLKDVKWMRRAAQLSGLWPWKSLQAALQEEVQKGPSRVPELRRQRWKPEEVKKRRNLRRENHGNLKMVSLNIQLSINQSIHDRKPTGARKKTLERLEIRVLDLIGPITLPIPTSQIGKTHDS